MPNKQIPKRTGRGRGGARVKGQRTTPLKPRLSAEERKEKLQANAAKARAAMALKREQAWREQAKGGGGVAAPATVRVVEVQPVERKRRGRPRTVRAADIEAASAANNPDAPAPTPSQTRTDPYLLTPHWRIVSFDLRQWGLQQLVTEAEPGPENEKHEGDEDEKVEGGARWRTVGYYSSLDPLLRAWAQRSMRSTPGPLVRAIATACSRLETLLTELTTATGSVVSKQRA